MKPLLDSIHHEHHWKICDFSLNAPVQNGPIISSLFQRRGKRGWGNVPLVDPQKTVLPLCNINEWWLVKVRMKVFDINKKRQVSRITDAKIEDTVFVSSWIEQLKNYSKFWCSTKQMEKTAQEVIKYAADR